MSDAPIPWYRPEVGEAERRAVLKVLDSGYLNDGEVTRRFEAGVARLMGVRHCVGVTSGTAAISLALMGLGVGTGDEVLVPDLTFIATANAVRLAGANVRLVDVDPIRFGIDAARLEQAVGPRTRAVLAVDVNGRGAGYEMLEPFCREHGLALVCDAAEALGSSYHGRMLGSFGDAGCFSFSPNKTVTTGQGGMIATNDDDLHDRLRELKDQGRRHQGTGGDDRHPVLGFNFKLTNLQAAIGLAQLEHLSARLTQARRRDAWYREALAECDGVTFPPTLEGEVPQWADIVNSEARDAVSDALEQVGIGCRRFWHPLHSQPPYAASGDAFPNAIAASREGLWLPSHFTLSESEVVRTAAVIRRVLVRSRLSAL